MKDQIQELVDWLREEVSAAGARGVVFGLSGGVDSALMAALGQEAFGEDSLGIIMPIDSAPEDEEDALLLSRTLGTRVERVDLGPAYRALVKESGDLDHDLARSNIKPRLRMTTLYYYGQALGYLVCGCTNASEFYTGYFTKYGDSACDLFPLVDFTKTEVYEMAKALGVPDKIINKRPTAGLFEGQDDEADMGFTYEELDAWIKEGKAGPNNERIQAMHRASAHKRVYAKIYRRKD